MPRRSMSTRRAVLTGLALLPVAARHGAAETAVETLTRPPNWATPVLLDGAPNLHRVEDNFFRSAQPSAAGFRNLTTAQGVRTVISLRAFNADEPLARGLDLRLVRFPIHTWNIERADVVAALRMLRRSVAEAPVLLHCQHGADRTGLVTALYRILYQGWSKDAALDEMLNGNFGYHAVWGNIPRFIRRVDVQRLGRDIGMP
jgi:protein tyrosine phosphatase (PTP) superfamily phosphohydrolase (DUF442 family)